jgi:hypothetical protein
MGNRQDEGVVGMTRSTERPIEDVLDSLIGMMANDDGSIVDTGETGTMFWHEFLDHRLVHGGHQWRFKFANGYGASVIVNEYSYGGREGLYEVAILDKEGEIDYTTPIASDVIGHLTEDDVSDVLYEISSLP